MRLVGALQGVLNLEGDESEHTINTYAGVAALKLFDLTDVNAPLSDVRAFLAARYDQRFSLNARLFEETVADVFRGLGYHARVTAYSGDDGIDVVLDGPDNTTIGVQVKRYRKRIKVAQIRELTGALVDAGITRGIFVTTSDFQAGGKRTARLSADAGWPIELFNAERFYDAPRLRQLASPDTIDTLAERLRQVPPRLIHSHRSGMRKRSRIVS